MKKDVIIPNKEEFNKKKEEIKKAGADNLHVVSDFDRTLTYDLNPEGKKTQTIFSILRNNPDYLGQDYVDKTVEWFNYYNPIETNSNIPLEEKKLKMKEWWKKHLDFLVKKGFNKDLIQRVVKENPLKFRKGSLEFFSFLNERAVPFVIISAAPGDMLETFLNYNNLYSLNVKVIANKYKFDSKGNAIELQEPIIHTFNKKEISLLVYSVYEEIKNRTYTVLLGDSLGDAEMVEGFPYKEIIKIGFLNDKIDEKLEDYKKNFDIVLTNDQDFGYVNKLIKELID